MAYARRRSTYRRKGRRGNRALSTRNIFNNKGARAQARQINALKRRINRVYSRTKPEVKVCETGRTERMLLPTIEENHIAFPFIYPQLGEADDQRVGSVVRMVQPTLFISGKYSAVTQSNPAPLYNLQLGNGGAGMRVIAVQSKIPISGTPDISSLLHNNISSSFQGVDSIANLRIPFEVGITTRFEVIYDKVFYFSANKPIFSKRINLRPKIRNLKWDPPTGGDESYASPVGTIYVYIIQAGLESNNVNLDTEGTDYTRITLSYTQKLAYTDA